MYNRDLTNLYISSSFQRVVQVSGSGYLLNGTGSMITAIKIGGDLHVDGSLIASSSIIYASGSTIFGDSSDDTHQFTGSMFVSGLINDINLQEFSSSVQINIENLQADSGSFETRITNNDSDIYNLQLDSGSFETRITDNTSNILFNSSSIENLQSDSGSFEIRITNNTSDILINSGSFQTRISDLEVSASRVETYVRRVMLMGIGV